MHHPYPLLRRGFILFLLFTVMFGVGSKASFCMMPNGDIHMVQNHLFCDDAGGDSAPAHASVCRAQVENQGRCLDISAGVDASGRQQRCLSQFLVPVMLPVGPAILFAATDSKPVRVTIPARSSQLLSLQSVILLI